MCYKEDNVSKDESKRLLEARRSLWLDVFTKEKKHMLKRVRVDKETSSLVLFDSCGDY